MSISIGAQPIPWAGNGRKRDLDDDDPAVRFDGVSRRFGETVALDEVSFTVPRGTVVGLLGSNGAGKSTAIRILLGHARADAGSAHVFGRPLRDHPLPLLRVGAVAESVGLLPWMGAADWLESVCRAAGFPRERIAAVLDQTDATSFAKKPIKTLSSGMRQRVALATALLGDPDLLVLDEPQNGLDPDGIRWLRRLLREFAGQGRSVLLSSHLLSEVEQSVDRVVMIRNRVLFEGTLAELPYPGRLEESYFALVDLERGREQRGERRGATP
ncbi:MAG TPA: ATP-binding cassette domain-containing protein [Acidimicrobiales bacterium]